nr:stage III sporulation protein AE [uncultured Blautia sp.]
MKRWIIIWLAVCFIFFLWTDCAWGEEIASGDDFVQEQLLGQMDFENVQQMLDQALGKDEFSFSDAIKSIMSGSGEVSKETLQRFLQGLFFNLLKGEKDTLFRILLLILGTAFLTNLSAVFEDGQAVEITFYMLYLLLFIMIMNSFSKLSQNLYQSLCWIRDFMKVLTPAYFMAVAASTGATTAAVFYQGVLMLTWMIQWILTAFLLPGANLYILLCLVNHLSKESMLSKLADLLESLISWGLKSLIGIVTGLQIVKGMVAPVMDSLKRTAIGKTASVIPGIGNAVNAVTELVVTTGVLVRNCVGVAALLALLITAAAPVLHYGFLCLAYRFLAALAQPVADKRIVGALTTMGEGCGLLLRILLTAEVLCMLTLIILTLSFGGGG